MENWEKAKGTGQQENNPQEGKQIFRAASRRGPKTKEKASPVLTVQMALCGFLLVLVLAVRSFSPELFAALGSAYGRALTDGAALTGSGELFRFAEKNLQSLQEKLRRAIAQLDGGAATNAGSAPAVGVAAAGGDEITIREYNDVRCVKGRRAVEMTRTRVEHFKRIGIPNMAKYKLALSALEVGAYRDAYQTLSSLAERAEARDVEDGHLL